MTRPYAEVIGDPIAHSKSPLIHNFWLGKLGIDADYRACHVRPEELPKYFARRRRDAEWRGCNITMPHKQAALPLLDTVSRQASRIGAVNCVYEQQARLVGENTDVDGVLEPLRRPDRSFQPGPDHAAIHVQIIGAGGAARAAAAAASTLGDVEIYNRDAAKARALARRCGLPEQSGHGLEAIGPHGGDGARAGAGRTSLIVINASALGMGGNPPAPVPLARYDADTIVFDMVYDPPETPLLREARQLGLRAIDGLEMLVGQAAAAFRLFFGVAAPREYDAELRALLTA